MFSIQMLKDVNVFLYNSDRKKINKTVYNSTIKLIARYNKIYEKESKTKREIRQLEKYENDMKQRYELLINLKNCDYEFETIKTLKQLKEQPQPISDLVAITPQVYNSTTLNNIIQEDKESNEKTIFDELKEMRAFIEETKARIKSIEKLTKRQDDKIVELHIKSEKIRTQKKKQRVQHKQVLKELKSQQNKNEKKTSKQQNKIEEKTLKQIYKELTKEIFDDILTMPEDFVLIDLEEMYPYKTQNQLKKLINYVKKQNRLMKRNQIIKKQESKKKQFQDKQNKIISLKSIDDKIRFKIENDFNKVLQSDQYDDDFKIDIIISTWTPKSRKENIIEVEKNKFECVDNDKIMEIATEILGKKSEPIKLESVTIEPEILDFGIDHLIIKPEIKTKKNNNKWNITNILYYDETPEKNIITLSEKFDKQALIKHIFSGECELKYAQSLCKYISNSKEINNGTDKYNEIEIKYTIHKIGRLGCSITAKGKDDNDETIEYDKFINSQTYQWKNTKHATSSKYCKDIDINNAQPVLLEQLMRYHGLPTPHLTYYNENRNEIFKKFMKNNKLTKQEVKGFLYKIMFNKEERVSYIIKNRGYIMEKSLLNYIIELFENRDILLSFYPDLIEESKRVEQAIKNKTNKKYKNKSSWGNIQGRALALLCQTLERGVLLSMVKYCQNNGYKVNALIHDGFHLQYNDDIDLDDLLKKIEKYVKVDVGFNINLSVKNFEREEGSFDELNFDEMKGDKELNIPVININNKFLTKKNDDDDENIDLYKHILRHNNGMNNNIYLVKSYTGSGKTTMIKKLIENNPDKKILSLVSRRSLSDTHELCFKIKNYQTTVDHGLNEVYQIDSINKIPELEDGQKYVLIIDEIASLLKHLLCDLSNLSRHRLLIVEKLNKVIDEAELVIGTDRNINYGTCCFLKKITDKNITLYNNKYVENRNAPVIIYDSNNEFLGKAIEMIKNGEKVIFSSNMNNKFMNNIVDVVIKECDIEKKDYLVYASDRGEEKINTELWKDKKIIFATPTIIYGCDSIYNFNVFGIYYNAHHFCAMDIDQQINRERNPKSFHLYIENVYKKPYSTLKKAKENIKSSIQISYDLVNEDKYKKYIKALRKLYIYETYRLSYHENIKFYTIELLKKKGYKNIMFNFDNNKTFDKIKIEEITNNLIENFVNNDNDLDVKKKNDIIDKLDIFGLDVSQYEINQVKQYLTKTKNKSHIKKMNKFISIVNEMTSNRTDNKYLKYFMSNKEFRKLIAFNKYSKFEKIFLFDVIEADDDLKFKMKKENYDIIEKISTQDNFKFQLLNLLGKYIDFEPTNIILNEWNYKELVKIPSKKKFLEQFKKAFNIRTKKEIKNIRHELISLYMKSLKSLIGDAIVSKKHNFIFYDNKERKRLSIPEFESANIKIRLNIVLFRRLYSEVKSIINSNKCKFDDDIDYDNLRDDDDSDDSTYNEDINEDDTEDNNTEDIDDIEDNDIEDNNTYSPLRVVAKSRCQGRLVDSKTTIFDPINYNHPIVLNNNNINQQEQKKEKIIQKDKPIKEIMNTINKTIPKNKMFDPLFDMGFL